MAQLDVKAKITAPGEIQIPLVRADQLHTSNVFRIMFEICMAVAMSLLGVLLSAPEITNIHIAFFVFCAVLAIVFLVLSVRAIKPVDQVAGSES